MSDSQAPNGLTPRERERLLDELSRLKAQVADLEQEVARLRNSSWFRFREKVLPEGSLMQRLFLACRTGSGFDRLFERPLDYRTWIKRFDRLTQQDRERIMSEIAAMTDPPGISIVMPVYNPPARFLSAAVGSVRTQLYPHWELCIVNDASTEPHVRPILEAAAAGDSRIKVTFRAENGHISAASNEGLRLASCPFVGFLDNDDLLAEHALYLFARAIRLAPEVLLFFSDEDKIDASGNRFDPHFKSSNIDSVMLLGANYVSHLSVFQAELVREVGGFREGLEGAQDWDLLLRYTERIEDWQVEHIGCVLYHWRAIHGSTALATASKDYVPKAQLKAVREAVERRGLDADVERLDPFEIIRLHYHVRDSQPKVSVIIPTTDRVELLSKCISSLQSITEYANYEVLIVDNDSSEQDTLDYLAEISKNENVRVLRVAGLFNFSRLNNVAAVEAEGEILSLLNNDIEIVDPHWMTQLVAYAARPNVGAVGARLVYPNGKVQHGGVIIGLNGLAGHAHVGVGGDMPGYAGRAVLDQTVSAVTAACMFVRKSAYEQVGGFEEQLAVAFNDVDFCLRLWQLGLKCVYAGSVTCIHHESATRGTEDTPKKQERFEAERDFMLARWMKEGITDPYYNPNLSLSGETYALNPAPRGLGFWL